MLRKTLAITTLLLCMSASAAQNNIYLYVSNLSSKPIVIKKSDGSTVSIAAGQTIDHVSFQRTSNAQNYVGNKLSCTWRNLDDADESRCTQIVGIQYSETSSNQCDKQFRQVIPC